LAEEQAVLSPLPARRLEDCTVIPAVRVSAGSTISVKNNVYSVDSRLIGEKLRVKVYAERLELWYGQRAVENLPRLRGEGKHRINYRHIIDWLVRKPGAFQHYRYREDLFPSVQFRRAYDTLASCHQPQKASKEYLKILHLAAKEGESVVEEALRVVCEMGGPISFTEIEWIVGNWKAHPQPPAVLPSVAEVALADYDELLEPREVAG
jgi:hypothetical protein